MNWAVFLLWVLVPCSAFSIELFVENVINNLLAPIRGIQKAVRFLDVSTKLTREVTYAGKEPKLNEYDFIVVGMSPSGCVIANRLTEEPRTTVLLLEAGQEDNVITDIPALNPYILISDYNWAFYPELAKGVCTAMTGGICPWPSGKGPGGGTILNGMIYTRGNFRDYDNWAAEGNPGWSYNEIKHYFNKIERMTIKELRNSPYHGRNGYLSISYVPFVSPLLEAFLQAGEFFGFSRVDYNNPNSHIGFSQIQSSTILGERETSARAYIQPIIGRPNLFISLRSRVAKVLIDYETKRAFGVTYIKDGKLHAAYAKKEVVLAAGAFNSPQLLMLSGIGHADHLEEIGIPVLMNLPVGDNLMEHVGMHALSFILNKNVSLQPLQIFRDAIPNVLDYFVKSRGSLTTLGCEGISYLKTKYSNTTEDYPDIELLFVASSFSEDAGVLLRKTFGMNDETYDYVFRAIDGKSTFSIWPMLLYPQSRGFVRLKDNSPFSKVRIYHNFLTERIDRLILVEAIKMAIVLSTSPSFQKYGAKLWDRPFPQCVQYDFGSDEYWECVVTAFPSQWHHQSGTCKMGNVVNHRLRVFGTVGLRVADASIMPTITGGHTQAVAYMIGEKAADLIKEDWQLSKYS
ncbi:glucose dehydrogenase [FAD, quinone]-like [Cimex lectularius]|uniref:Glucose-methanol-choline oxidoreductase N-terminal domain-containing protein n=1 Tax=Cimex lectularius TaxID=79782 RepID=A0A8I6R8X5_CIMLE|nr:glucose dehydrogenase [FAD, quinone]-like [Cimex lectularius]XP_024083718.1 glucose dehydrogenase [FAD, quinone]-like [Cimex lectularius]